MGAWYTIGLALGLALGVGVIFAGLLGVNAVGVGVATVAGAAAGVADGILLGSTAEIVAGGIAGAVGALSGAAVVHGAMRRGATRMGVAAYVGAAGLLLCLIALIPAIGYLAVVAVPVLAARMRGRRAARYAGLRTLAK